MKTANISQEVINEKSFLAKNTLFNNVIGTAEEHNHTEMNFNEDISSRTK